MCGGVELLEDSQIPSIVLGFYINRLWGVGAYRIADVRVGRTVCELRLPHNIMGPERSEGAGHVAGHPHGASQEHCPSGRGRDRPLQGACCRALRLQEDQLETLETPVVSNGVTYISITFRVVEC